MKTTKRAFKNEKGIASIEAVAMLIVFVILMAYAVGMFGVIHTGILNSIAARTYAWETFDHRTNVNLFRDRAMQTNEEHYVTYGFRLHAIASERAPAQPHWDVTERVIAMGRETETAGTRFTSIHAQLTGTTKRERVGVNPVWIKTLYGICLNSACGAVNL